MILIGEKINGAIPVVAEAIRERNEAFIRERARMQAASGADYLDVCASVQMEQEAETFKWLIDIIQDETNVPLCIDSPNPWACYHAAKLCKRPGLINSVSMEGQKADILLPLIAQSAWNCIVLLCDDAGIPASVDGRMEVLDRFMARADALSISHDRLFIDPLVVTLSTSPDALATFTACCRRIKATYPEVHITSGLSNISFGLPSRKYLNQAFLVLARNAGMDSAILDPTNADIRGLLAGTEALLGYDPNCIAYIDRFTPKANVPLSRPVPENTALSAVHNAVLSGLVKETEPLVAAALNAHVLPEEILGNGMISAMTALGDRFSRGEAFVPQLLMAARAMKKGVAVLKPYLANAASTSLGKVVIGTVAGDQHDIGKNLVAMMLESAGFQVLDLGADVSAERFCQTVLDNPDVRIVALSALLTTTMPSMRAIVHLLNNLPTRQTFRIMVGGAPITEAFSREIGADAYSEDAASAAKKAKSLIRPNEV